MYTLKPEYLYTLYYKQNMVKRSNLDTNQFFYLPLMQGWKKSTKSFQMTSQGFVERN